MKLLITAVASALLTLAIQYAALAGDPTSLAEVGAIIADAMATNDTFMVQRYLKTYEDVTAGLDGKKISKSDFLKVLENRKGRTESIWREIREKKVLPEDIKIVDVQLQESDNPNYGKYSVVGIVYPVFKVDGELIPLQWAMLTFVDVNGKWKFIY